MTQSRLAQGKSGAGWILLRGLVRECRHWGAFPEHLATRLGEPVRCLELPGNGIYHEQASPMSIAAMLERIRSEARLEAPVYLLGLSLGGMIAALWAARYPQEVAGLVLVNSSSGLSPPWQRMRLTALPLLLLALIMPSAQREALIYRLTCARWDDRHATLRQWIRYADEHPVRYANLVRQLGAAARYRLADRPASARPLLLCSRGDRLVSARCSHTLAQAWHADIREHPWAGHDLPHDDPDWLLNELVRYRHHG